MAKLKLIGFVGENPKVIPRLLSDMGAQEAFNVRLDDGGLTPIRKHKFAYEFPSGAALNFRTIYRWNEQWFGYNGDVYLAPGPVATERLYIMGDGAPKMYANGAYYPLAVPRPAVKLGATLNGAPAANSSISTRLYVFTWVTQFGEESEPSIVTDDVNWSPGQSVTLSGFPGVPAGRGIISQRIYRAQTGKTGTQMYFIDERPASSSNYTDNISPESLQEQLPSVAYQTPLNTLTGLISLPNGMMAAFSGKELYFCEPYQPHAWPEAYSLAMDYPIVALGAFESSIVVMTEGTPYIVTGTSPENMVAQRIERDLPCINSRGVVDMGYSVVYPSHDGLVQVSAGAANVVSTGMFSRDDWLRLNPFGMVASQYNGRYFTSYNYSDVQNIEHSGTFLLDLTGEQAFLIRATVRAQAMFYDKTVGVLYLLIDGSIYEWDAQSEANAIQTWRSKLFVLPTPTNFGAVLVEGDANMSDTQAIALQAEIDRIKAANTAAFNSRTLEGEVNGMALNVMTMNGDILQPVPTLSMKLAVNIYADRKLVATTSRLNLMDRLPSGFKARVWEVEVTGDAPITQVTLATTGAELAEI
jgi:hypothetical protein